jgi:hypothetical protein
MIPKDLKVGDVFCDGGLYYEVQAICVQGYISKKVEKPIEKKETVDATDKQDAPVRKSTRGRKKS